MKKNMKRLALNVTTLRTMTVPSMGKTSGSSSGSNDISTSSGGGGSSGSRRCD